MTSDRTSLGRVVGSSMLGTTIEWYDFFLYISATSLVFDKLFFPNTDPLAATLALFGVSALGFVFRPIGGLVFGHYGDRIGRKKLLVLSLFLVGGATFLIGCLPTYATIGALAPVLLVLLRMVQGFALGGEWGGAVLMISERTSEKNRGFWASWPQAGAPAGQLLATAVLAFLAAFQSDEAFLAWGWRIPFLLSAVLFLIGVWIRVSVHESPLFQRAVAKQPEKAPLVTVLREHPRQVLVGIGARIAENTSYYIFTAFILVYVTKTLAMPKAVALNAVLIGSVIHFVTIPMWAALSDRIGRRPLYILGAAGVGAWTFVFFNLIDTRSATNMTIAVTVGLLFHGAMYGPQAAFISELFATKVRYSGASIASQVSSIAAGATAPILATALLASYGTTFPIAVYVAIGSVVTLIAVLAATETRGRDLAEVAPAAPTTPETAKA